MRRLKQIEQKNGRLKKLVAERDLEIEVVKEIAAKMVRVQTRREQVTYALPPVDQQTRIAANLDALAEDIRRSESIASGKLAALDELKQSLLRPAFSGAL